MGPFFWEEGYEMNSDGIEKVRVYQFIQGHPECNFDRIVSGVNLTRKVVKECTADLTNQGILDPSLRIRGLYKAILSLPASEDDPPPSVPDDPQEPTPKRRRGRPKRTEEPVPVNTWRLVEYVKRLNAAYGKLQAECSEKDRRIGELERQLSEVHDVEGLIVHKDVLD